MIRWGILGAGKIAQRFAESLKNEPRSELYAIGVRSEEKALEFKKSFDYEVYYLDYETMLIDSQIDAIYLSLPHQLHKEWAIKALNHGKAVLCEKPAALNAKEVQEIVDVAKSNNVLFMEAMKSRFLPAYDAMLKTVKNGEIGDVTHVEAAFCVEMPFDKMPNTYHTKPVVGGVLLDMGIYCASFIEEFLGSGIELEKVYATVRDSVDYYVDAYLKSGDITARLETSFLENKPRNAKVVGTLGTIELIDFHRSQKIVVTIDSEVEEIEIKLAYDDFYGEISHFVDLIKNHKAESDKMSFENSINAAALLDTIRSGYTDYDQSVLDVLEDEETLLQYESFSSHDAWVLGETLIEMSKPYGKDIAIQIVREADDLVIFQYMMDSKSSRNLMYMNGKRKASLQSEHASIYPGVLNRISKTALDALDIERDGLPVGGAFPIRVNGNREATLIVSGLHEGKDHELIIKALSSILQKTPSHTSKALF